MKKADKMQKSAGWTEQKLPEGQLAADGAEIAAQQPLPATTSPASSSSTADDGGLRTLERTYDLVALHALRLSNTGIESLRVVVEPGDGTHLSLELRRGPSGIEAQAVLHHGDFDFLNQHWPQLQQRLESRGVHLASLRSSGQSQNFGRQQTKADSAKGTITEFAFGGSMTESPAAKRARPKTDHSWETWT
jgi:hypothetical protein